MFLVVIFRVLYISIHRGNNGSLAKENDFYPYGPGKAAKFTGKGAGLGFNVNLPWALPVRPRRLVRGKWTAFSQSNFISGEKRRGLHSCIPAVSDACRLWGTNTSVNTITGERVTGEVVCPLEVSSKSFSVGNFETKSWERLQK